MGKLKLKLINLMSDIECDIRFLRNKNVSTAFKIANIVTGDRLRPELSFAAINIGRAEKMLERCREDMLEYCMELAAASDEKDVDSIAIDLAAYVRQAELYIKKVSRCAENIWKI